MLHAAAKEGLARAEIPACALLFLFYPRLPTEDHTHTPNQTQLYTHTHTHSDGPDGITAQVTDKECK